MSALNATIYSSSRVSFAMGRDRNLPSWFGSVHPVRKTPHWAILASGVLSVVMAVTLPIEAVASAANIMFLLLFIQVQAALIALRKKRPDLRRGFKVPFVPFVPIIGIILQLALAVVPVLLQPDGVVERGGVDRPGAGGFLRLLRAGGTAPTNNWWPCARRRNAGNTGSSPASGTRSGRASSSTRRWPSPGTTTGELIALSVVEVPDRQTAGQQGLERAHKIRDSLDQAVAALRNDGIPVRTLVKISHRISYGITETALEEQCNLIVMGRARRVGLLERFAATDCGPSRPFRPGAGDGRHRRTLAGAESGRSSLPTNAGRIPNWQRTWPALSARPTQAAGAGGACAAAHGHRRRNCKWPRRASSRRWAHASRTAS